MQKELNGGIQNQDSEQIEDTSQPANSIFGGIPKNPNGWFGILIATLALLSQIYFDNFYNKINIKFDCDYLTDSSKVNLNTKDHMYKISIPVVCVFNNLGGEAVTIISAQLIEYTLVADGLGVKSRTKNIFTNTRELKSNDEIKRIPYRLEKRTYFNFDYYYEFNFGSYSGDSIEVDCPLINNSGFSRFDDSRACFYKLIFLKKASAKSQIKEITMSIVLKTADDDFYMENSTIRFEKK